MPQYTVTRKSNGISTSVRGSCRYDAALAGAIELATQSCSPVPSIVRAAKPGGTVYDVFTWSTDHNCHVNLNTPVCVTQ